MVTPKARPKHSVAGIQIEHPHFQTDEPEKDGTPRGKKSPNGDIKSNGHLGNGHMLSKSKFGKSDTALNSHDEHDRIRSPDTNANNLRRVSAV